MHKKGQLTVFILLGLVLIIAGAFFIYLNNKPPITEAPATIQDAFTPIDMLMHNCWDDAAQRAVTRIGMFGGTLTPDILGAPWLFHTGVTKGIDTVPSTTDLENEISYGAGVFTAPCEKDIVDEATARGITLTLGPMDIKTRLSEYSVSVTFKEDSQMSTGSASRKVSDMSFRYNTKLGLLAAYANYLAEGVATRGLIDIFPVRAAGINASIYSGPTSIGAVALQVDENAPNITSRFLLAFDQSGETPKYYPVVKPVQPINATAGVQTLGVVLALDPLNGPLTFKADNLIVHIDKDTGAFEIKPSPLLKGLHPVTFTVTNERNLSSEVTTVVTVG